MYGKPLGTVKPILSRQYFFRARTYSSAKQGLSFANGAVSFAVEVYSSAQDICSALHTFSVREMNINQSKAAFLGDIFSNPRPLGTVKHNVSHYQFSGSQLRFHLWLGAKWFQSTPVTIDETDYMQICNSQLQWANVIMGDRVSARPLLRLPLIPNNCLFYHWQTQQLYHPLLFSHCKHSSKHNQ